MGNEESPGAGDSRYCFPIRLSADFVFSTELETSPHRNAH